MAEFAKQAAIAAALGFLFGFGFSAWLILGLRVFGLDG